MKYVINFDESSSKWEDLEEYNYLFVRSTCNCLNERLAHKGYVYLEHVYELLGAKWNPDDENVVFRADKCSSNIFSWTKTDNGYAIVANI